MSTEVRKHERHTPSGGTTTVRRHARKTGWSPGQFDEVSAAVSAFSFSVISVVIWSLTFVMSLTAAILSVVSTLALAVLGHQTYKRRKARRTHTGSTPKTVWKRRGQVARHPLVHLRHKIIRRLKQMLGRAEQAVAGRNDPRRAK